MAKQSAADILVERLLDWGVEVVFGMPGDGINGLMEALRKCSQRIQFIQVRHEEAAAFMACAYAKYSGRLGVCLATSGPGGIHLLNGLYDAKLDGQPVLALTGLQFHDLIGTSTQQDVELDKLFMDVAKFNARIMGAAHVENMVDVACRTALAYQGVSHLTFPVDLQSAPAERKGSKRNIPYHSSDEFARTARLPTRQDLEQAAAILNSGERIVILAGRGALGATDELLELAERLGAPIAKALLGKACVPDDSPYTTGPVGMLGSRPSQQALENCDTLLIVGSSFPYIEYYPAPGQARAVQIELDPARLGLRYPVEVGLIGDSARTLQELLPLLEYQEKRDFLERAQQGMEDWQALMRDRGTVRDTPMKPQVVAWELGRRLPDNAIVSCDSGTITTWFARQIPVKRGQMHSLSGTLASMANGLPYAIAAKIAHPDRPSVAFVGDGGLSMLMAELATCVKYQLDVKIVVIKNNSLGMIKWEQMVFLGNPEYGCELQPIDFVSVAKGFGVSAFHIEDPAACGATLERAFATDGPVLVEALVDPHEPPLPPSVDLKDAKHFAQALIKGQPNRKKIALTALSDKVRELI
ncbi:pyruvate oxidase [Candidatus Tenderia electrophaga]|jgi:pyruvate dehydrogenase (quinone)/pyruvate oxidase|uniref:Pyruvate oxidase n=1 Tax=Candidatus Tenderia electrophaga TaxID=1748243 RepID=A0A0S2TFJ3_9GAMM|nr:pyruvate oxidase [Candidatus Tenderia electrophaga]